MPPVAITVKVFKVMFNVKQIRTSQENITSAKTVPINPFVIVEQTKTTSSY